MEAAAAVVVAFPPKAEPDPKVDGCPKVVCANDGEEAVWPKADGCPKADGWPNDD